MRRIDRIAMEAANLPYGATRTAMFQEATDIADTHNELERGFEIRSELMESAMVGGQPELLLVAFSWCLSMSDLHPNRFPGDRLLWEYRWVINELTSFPTIPRAKIEEVFAEMIDRYTEAGSSLRAVWLLGRNIAIAMGDGKMANDCHRKWKAAPRDHLSDDLVTERVFHMSYVVFLKKYEKAVEIGMPFFRNEITDERFASGANGDLLYPLFLLGRLADAMTCHRRGIRPIARKPQEFNIAAAHIDFLCLTANVDAAVPLYEKFLPAAIQSTDISRQFTFHLCGLMLANCLTADVKLRLPKEVLAELPESARTTANVADLRVWVLGLCETLADAFDARNGTPHHRWRLSEHLKLVDRIRPWPLRRSGTGDSKSTFKHE